MDVFVDSFLNFIISIFYLLDNVVVFDFRGISVSFLQISLVFTVFAITVSVFWRGGRA